MKRSASRNRRPHDPPGEGRDAVALVEDLLREAARAHASDVHLEPTAEGVDVRFRLDGLLQTVRSLTGRRGTTAVGRVMVLAGLLTYRMDIPQEGRIGRPGDWADDLADLRVATFPTVHGQRAVIRLLYDERGLSSLPELGLPAGVAERLGELAESPGGLVLVTGPAGSGKSTTLSALLGHIVRTRPGRSIVTLEDPVERHIEGVTQVPIDAHGELTFPRALRSLLRQDPQVLMIGEIRDAETARIAVEAALTGHLLTSTMHSGSPAGALLRLLEMGVEPYQLTSSILAVANQRLVRRLCEHCRRPAGDGRRAEAVGCDACLDTGYRGRLPLAQLVEMDGSLRQAVLDRADRDRLETLIAQRGQQTLRQAGRALVWRGWTTDQELLAVLGPDPADGREHQ